MTKQHADDLKHEDAERGGDQIDDVDEADEAILDRVWQTVRTARRADQAAQPHPESSNDELPNS